jgi:hypothetical protein
MSQKASSTIAAGWLDLSTFGGLDKVFYDGDHVDPLHTTEIKPVSHFTRIPVPLAKSGQVDGAVYKFAKTADFAGNTHLEFTTPDITVKEDLQAEYRIAFCRNLGHHVIKGGYTLEVNDIPLVKVDPVAMDFLSEANYVAGKYEGYMEMIGNVDTAVTFGSHLPPQHIVKPLHELFFCQNNESAPQTALPLCQLKHNTLTIKAEFVDSLEDVIRVQKFVPDDPAVPAVGKWVDQDARAVNLTDIVNVAGGKLDMPLPDAWCEYVLVREDERKFHKANPREIAIQQIQAVSGPKVTTGVHRLDFRLSKPVRFFMFGARNASASAIRNHANYSTDPADPAAGLNPVDKVTLWYDNAPRTQNMPASFYSKMEFLYHAERVPTAKGVHLHSYCYRTTSPGIDGSINFSKLNSSLELALSETSTNSDDEVATGSTYSIEIRAQSQQLVLVKDGAMSFPSY